MGAMGWHAKSTFVPLWGGLPALWVLHPAVNLDKGSPSPPPYPTHLPLSRVSPDAKAQDMSSINHSF